MKTYTGYGDEAPPIIDLGAGQEWVVNFTLWLLYLWQKEPLIPCA
jgi:hypothetical protein